MGAAGAGAASQGGGNLLQRMTGAQSLPQMIQQRYATPSRPTEPDYGGADPIRLPSGAPPLTGTTTNPVTSASVMPATITPAFGLPPPLPAPNRPTPLGEPDADEPYLVGLARRAMMRR